MAGDPRERLRQVGAEVRRLRTAAGLSGPALAERAGVSQPTVSRVENGRAVAGPDVVARMLGALDLHTSTRDWLNALVTEAYAELAERRRSGAGVSLRSGAARERERTALVVRCFQCAVIPALVQTEAYARHALATGQAGDNDGGEVAEALAARLARQAILDDDRRRFTFVLTEGALRTWPETPALMPAQLDRLRAVAERPNVRLGVVPWSVGVPAFPLHGFTLYDEDAVGVETFTHELTVTDEADLAVYAETFAAFERAAVFGDGAGELLDHIAADYRALTEQGLFS